jgi:Lamin Tail Domain
MNGGASGWPSPGPGELEIVELLINPTGTDTGREWIEIVNRTSHTLSLAGLHIADAANDAALDFATGGGGVLVAGARSVLIQSGDATKNGGVTLGGTVLGGTFGTLVSLNNDADTISICVGLCSTGILIDRVTWDATLGAGYDGHALVIDDSARRCPATLTFGDTGSFGTPGAPNGACP